MQVLEPPCATSEPRGVREIARAREPERFARLSPRARALRGKLLASHEDVRTRSGADARAKQLVAVVCAPTMP